MKQSHRRAPTYSSGLNHQASSEDPNVFFQAYSYNKAVFFGILCRFHSIHSFCIHVLLLSISIHACSNVIQIFVEWSVWQTGIRLYDDHHSTTTKTSACFYCFFCQNTIFYSKYTVSKKTDTPIMSHNSSKNGTVSMIYDTSNCPSTLDTLP